MKNTRTILLGLVVLAGLISVFDRRHAEVGAPAWAETSNNSVLRLNHCLGQGASGPLLLVGTTNTVNGSFYKRTWSAAAEGGDATDGSCQAWEFTGSVATTVTFTAAPASTSELLYLNPTAYPMTITASGISLNGVSGASYALAPHQNATIWGDGSNIFADAWPAAASYSATPTAGGTVTVVQGATLVYLTPAGTLATLTVVLPALNDGQCVVVNTSQTLTALTVNAPGAGSLSGGSLTSLSANGSAKWCNSGGIAGTYSLTGTGGTGFTLTDGTHTVLAVTNLAVTGAVAGGVSPNGTVTISASATSFTPGTTTILGATAPCFLENSTSTTSACSALGTGAGTALGVNVGSSGAFVVNGGAGGTPSSITLTNASGTAASLTAGAASAVALSGITGLGTNVGTALANAINGTGGFATYVIASSSAYGQSKCDNVTIICPSGVFSTTVPDSTKTSSYQIAAGDMGGQVNYNGSSLTATLPAESSTIFAPGMSVWVTNQNASALTVTNSTGLTLGGCSGTSIPQYGGWALTANANGTALDCQATGVLPNEAFLNVAQSFSAQQTFAAVNGSTNAATGSGTSCNQAATTCTLVAADCGKTEVFANGSSAVTVTIPASIVPAAGTSCIITVVEGGTAKVSVNGSAVSAATLVSANSYTGTAALAGAAISLTLTTVGSTATAYLTGNGS